MRIAMTVTLDNIRDELEVDFGLACQKLIEAQARQKERDTPENRAAVAQTWRRIDTILDLLLEMGSTSLV
jgi:hypothetical protein